MRLSMILLTLTALLMAPPLQAEVPFLFPVSGVLSDQNDVPLHGNRLVVFSLYSASTDGIRLGGETQTVTFTNGLFQAYIGQETSGGLSVTPFIQHDEIWLGIKVGTDSEMSRVRLAAVPWAFEAFQCEQVINLTTAGIQAAIPAGACGANAAMRGWSGGSAQCVTLPDTSSFVTHGDIGTAVQSPISQLQPCIYGVARIEANGTVTCRTASSVVAACGANQYLDGNGICRESPHKCGANQYLDGNGICREAPHKCAANQYLDGDGTCVPIEVRGTPGRVALFDSGASVGDSIITQPDSNTISVAGDATIMGTVTINTGMDVTAIKGFRHSVEYTATADKPASSSDFETLVTEDIPIHPSDGICFISHNGGTDITMELSTVVSRDCSLFQYENQWRLQAFVRTSDSWAYANTTCRAQCLEWNW